VHPLSGGMRLNGPRRTEDLLQADPVRLMPAAAAGSVGANEGRISPVRSDDDARACGKRKREQQNEWPHFPSDPHA
jgi:hypothetical protein